MTYRCPGSGAVRTPELKTKTCPVCGGDIDLFSNEARAVCDACGFVAYNETLTCLQWCRYARNCVGDEIYERFLQDHPAPH